MISYELSITGIDGCGKSTSISNLIDKESQNYDAIAMVGKSSYIDGQKFDNRKYLFKNVSAAMDLGHCIGTYLKSRFLVSGVNAVNGLVCTAINLQIRKKYNPDIIIYGRDLILDPAVYLPIYHPSTKNISMEKRLNFFSKIFKTNVPSNLVYLFLDPQIALERIDARIREHNSKPGNIECWKHLHETKQGLSFLAEEFEKGLFELRKNGTKILRIDTGRYSLEDVVEQIRQNIHANVPL